MPDNKHTWSYYEASDDARQHDNENENHDDDLMVTLDGRDPRLQQKQPQLPLLLPMPWQQRLFRISSLL